MAGIAISIALAAQQTPNKPEFEVVSIKPADPSAASHMAQWTQAGYRGRNIRLIELIMGAWQLNHDQNHRRAELAGNGWVGYRCPRSGGDQRSTGSAHDAGDACGPVSPGDPS